jgi:hypothetical protein
MNQVIDKRIGARIDYGEVYMENGELYRNMVIQPNKDAENPTLKAKANCNSHQALAKLKISINNPPSAEEIAADILDQL